jgi:DNA-binding transcriptional LysR family regulator
LAWTLARNGEQVTPSVHGNFVSNDLLALIAAAVQGQGLAYVPLPRVLPLLRSGELKVVLPGWLSPAVEVFLHYPSRRGLPARVKAFVDFVLKQLRKHPDLQADPQLLLERLSH